MNQGVITNLNREIERIIEYYYDYSIEELFIEFDINADSKQKYSMLINSMLYKIDSDLLSYIENGSYVLKTVKLNKNGVNKESMSFPAFQYCDIISETWETSSLRNLFFKKVFLFAVFSENEHGLYLYDIVIWEMPQYVLDIGIRPVWERMQKCLLSGNIIKSIDNNKYFTYFPSSSENEYVHVRPHATNKKDTYPLPVPDKKTGIKYYVKHSYWLNRSYILKIVSHEAIDFAVSACDYNEKLNKNLVEKDQAEEEMIFIQEVYTIEEAKDVFCRWTHTCYQDGIELEKALRKKLQEEKYHIDGNVVIKGYKNASEYFSYCFMKEPLLNTTLYIDRFGAPIVHRVISKLEKRLELIKYEKNRYIRLDRLEQMGVSKRKLREYYASISSDDSIGVYFNPHSLKLSGFKSDIDELGFDDVFYESILKEEENLSKIHIGGTVVFSKKKEMASAASFLEKCVQDAEMILVDDLLEILVKNYGINITRYSLLNKLKKTQVFHDDILDYLYKDYDSYYNDV